MERAADGTVRIWVNAPPVDGEANDAVCRLVAKTVGVAKSSVEVVKGLQGRDKILSISGLSLESALLRIPEGKA